MAIKLRYGPIWLELGLLREAAGDKVAAEKCFQQALANPFHRAASLAEFARFCNGRGRSEDAIKFFTEAIQLSPLDLSLRVDLGQCLATAGRHDEAAKCFSELAQLAPDLMRAHFLCGRELLRDGRQAEAESKFREVVRQSPELIEGRLNLGLTLANQQRYAESLAEFDQVLQRSPTNALALQYDQALRKKLAPS